MTPRLTHYLAVLASFFCCLAPAGVRAQVLRGTFAAGTNHSLSIHADGTLWATGDNQAGQLGDGTTTARTSWQQVGTATNWVQVAAGWSHTLALRTDGTLWAWGDNALGQLGNATNTGITTANPVPTQVPGTYVQVAAGWSHTLALRADGTLWAWGSNSYGQLGNAATAGIWQPNPVPTQVPGIYVQVAAGTYHSLALRVDGSLWAWGSNYFGQLGNATGLSQNTANPVPAQLAGTYTQVAAGAFHSLALRADGSLWAWGSNQDGALGTATNSGTTTPNPVPMQVPGTYVRASAGFYHSLALRADGSLWAWGGNGAGQLGGSQYLGTTAPNPTPTQVPGTYVQVAAGFQHSLGLQANGNLLAWGGNTSGQLGTTVGVGTSNPNPTPTATGTALPTRSTAAGDAVGYAIKGDGTLWSWGDNNHGQLGDGTLTGRLRPSQVGTDHDWVQVVAGYSHVVARKANGTVWTWGSVWGGMAGTGNLPSLLVPTQVSVPLAASIAAGYSHSLALTATGTAYGWGSNTYGEVGNVPVTVLGLPPTAVAGGLTLTQLAAGRGYSLGVTATGTLYAWGYNQDGALGIVAGSGSAAPNPTPLPVPNLAGLVAVVAGNQHALGVTATGTAYAWGGNLYGQLGNAGVGGSPAYNAVPTLIAGLAGVRQVGAYAQHNLALLANGTIHSWGLNQWGALGQGTFSTTLVTVPAQEATLTSNWAQLGTGSSATASLVRTASAQNFASAGLNTAGQLGDGTMANWPRFDRMSPLTSLQPLPVLAAAGSAAFSLAPNPARTQATAVGLPPGTTLAVYDAVGRLVVATGSLTFSVAGLPAGVYLVRATVPGQAAQAARLLVE